MIEMKDITVLYAEDEEMVRIPSARMFEVMFRNVIVASDGDEAFELFRRHEVDLVITDLRMPTSGIDLISNIREYDLTVPIVITTAYYDFNPVYEDIQGIHVLRKPFNIHDVIKLSTIAMKEYEDTTEIQKAYRKLKVASEKAKELLIELKNGSK